MQEGEIVFKIIVVGQAGIKPIKLQVLEKLLFYLNI